MASPFPLFTRATRDAPQNLLIEAGFKLAALRVIAQHSAFQAGDRFQSRLVNGCGRLRAACFLFGLVQHFFPTSCSSPMAAPGRL